MEANQQFMTTVECEDVASVMGRKYATFMQQRHFEVNVHKDSYGVFAKVILRNTTGSFYYPVEGRISHMDHDMSNRDAIVFLLDYIDSYFAEYFREGGDVYLPIDWAEYEYDGVALQLKGQILNLEVERMADELLAGDGQPQGGSGLH